MNARLFFLIISDFTTAPTKLAPNHSFKCDINFHINLTCVNDIHFLFFCCSWIWNRAHEVYEWGSSYPLLKSNDNDVPGELRCLFEKRGEKITFCSRLPHIHFTCSTLHLLTNTHTNYPSSFCPISTLQYGGRVIWLGSLWTPQKQALPLCVFMHIRLFCQQIGSNESHLHFNMNF